MNSYFKMFLLGLGFLSLFYFCSTGTNSFVPENKSASDIFTPDKLRTLHVDTDSGIMDDLELLQREINPSPMFHAWENPYTGGALHVNERDQLVVYKSSFGFLSGNGAQPMVIEPSAIHHFLGSYGMGLETGILLTTEISPRNSKTFTKVLEELDTAGVRLFYYAK